MARGLGSRPREEVRYAPGGCDESSGYVNVMLYER